MSLKALYFHTLILFSLILVSFGSEAVAQNIQLDIPDNVTAPTGSTVNIPVNIVYNYTQQPEDLSVNPPVLDPNRIVAFSFAVYFNQAVIQPDVINFPVDQTGTLTQGGGWSCTPNTTTPGRLGLACATGGAGFRPTPGAQNVLVNLVFNVVGQPNSPSCCTAINFSTIEGETPRFQNRTGATVPTTATGGSFFVQGTTAASVNVAGRVLTANGRGLRGAHVRLTTADGATRTAVTSTFGYYRFSDIQAGQTVTIEVMSKRYGFQSQTVNLSGDVSNLNFIAQP